MYAKTSQIYQDGDDWDLNIRHFFNIVQYVVSGYSQEMTGMTALQKFDSCGKQHS